MIKKLEEVLLRISVNRILVVSKSSFVRLKLDEFLAKKGIEVTLFCSYNPNPDYEDIVNGVRLFVEKKCQGILAVGGGSTIDVAKCIKAYANMNHEQDYMEQKINPNDIPLIAIPTTAGSGSEATPNAVIYRKKIKQSVAHPGLKPDYSILEGAVLNSLPLYQRRCTAMDAVCQAIESWWSLKSTEESRDYSKKSVEMILPVIITYCDGDNSEDVTQRIMEGSNLAGKAIAIAGTTVPHAMSYRLTGLYGIAHGHGVALTLPKVWKHMIDNIAECTDSRGEEYVKTVFGNIAEAVVSNGESAKKADKMAGSSYDSSANRKKCEESRDWRKLCEEAIGVLERMMTRLELGRPVCGECEVELKNLSESVPESKCNTNPVKTTAENVRYIYSKVIEKECAKGVDML